MASYPKSMKARSIFLLLKYVETSFDTDLPVRGNFCLAFATSHTNSEAQWKKKKIKLILNLKAIETNVVILPNSLNSFQ